MQRYLRALFQREQPGALIELRYRYRAGMRQRFLPAADLFTAARTIVRLGINTDVYVGVAPRQRARGDKTSSAAQPVVALAAVTLVLALPVTQRLRRDPQARRQIRDRTALTDQLQRLPPD